MKTITIKTLQRLLLLLILMAGGGEAWGQVLYNQDYEEATDASSWTSANNSGGLSLVTGDATYGNYIRFYGDGISGSRTAYTNFYTTSDFYGDLITYTIEFDAAIRTGNTANYPTELLVASNGYSLAGNDYFTNSNTTNKNYLFLLKAHLQQIQPTTQLMVLAITPFKQILGSMLS